MRRSEKHPALTDEVARFQDEVRQLAFAAARAIVEQELARRRSKAPPVRAAAAAPARRGAATAVRQTSLPFPPQPAPPAPPAPSAPPPAPAGQDAAAPAGNQALDGAAAARPPESAAAPTATSPASSASPGNRKRVPWTREAIINELASWMLSGTAIDATFVQRYGPPGLVAAARRIFGRFDAALNVAGLHISKLYPDGPPTRGAT